MKKQTAVEWLMEQITYDNGYGQKWISFYEDTDLNIYFQQAKAMEKEQIVKAFYDGCIDTNSWRTEQYYTETYGQ